MNSRDSTRWDLERALGESGCAVCRLARVGVQRFFDGLLYENANDAAIRQRVADALGFCNRHAWQMRAQGGALGIALLNRDALRQWQHQLEHTRQPVHANRGTAQCLACEKQDEIEARVITVLIESLTDDDFRARLRTSAGLCRPHFARACAAASRDETLRMLVEIQIAVNARLLAELDEFIRKNDYRFIGEGFGAEGDAWLRAIEIGRSGARMLDFSALWFRDAFRHQGCPICYLRARDDARYIFTILYEFVTDGGVRTNFVNSLGYCHEHAWAQQRTEAEHWGDGLGTATMYESVLAQNLAGLDEFIRATRREIARARLPFWARLRKHLPRALPFGIEPRAPCRVCELGAQGERALLDTFAQKIEWDEFRAWYRASDGLCLP
ncbi:MAG: DUF6062 family protein, partial [Anaerolineae bacterium]|nr:DUF6062 family protein [Anaerolineae bacterium]